jgi:outer membrane lipoprotein-sorting protein
MRKIFIMAVVMLLLFVSLAFAETKEELSWKAYGLNEHLKVLSGDFQQTQNELKATQAKLDAIQKEEAAKAATEKKPVEKK